jgi:hypothetical protein
MRSSNPFMSITPQKENRKKNHCGSFTFSFNIKMATITENIGDRNCMVTAEPNGM